MYNTIIINGHIFTIIHVYNRKSKSNQCYSYYLFNIYYLLFISLNHGVHGGGKMGHLRFLEDKIYL